MQTSSPVSCSNPIFPLPTSQCFQLQFRNRFPRKFSASVGVQLPLDYIQTYRHVCSLPRSTGNSLFLLIINCRLVVAEFYLLHSFLWQIDFLFLNSFIDFVFLNSFDKFGVVKMEVEETVIYESVHIVSCRSSLATCTC